MTMTMDIVGQFDINVFVKIVVVVVGIEDIILLNVVLHLRSCLFGPQVCLSIG